jgi:hypothetical protein
MDSMSTPIVQATNPFLIRYVDVPRDAVSVRRHRLAVAARRGAIVAVAAVTVLGAGIGFSLANGANAALINAAVVATDPVRGEFRLGPGNLTPPGYVIPLDAESGLSDRVPVGVDAQWRPSLAPLR